ncbi:MAG: cation transporter [Phycisphaeraceae bacterium]|nr:cation transporter [Phycisphaeraceae bacterium]
MAQPQTTAAGQVRRLAMTGVLVNLGLAIAKLLAGIVGHSYALIADAIESIADILGSAVIWGGLHIGARPADENHPYGHGKAESLAALIVAVLVLTAGIGIGVKAVDQLLDPQRPPAPWTLLVLLAVVGVKTTLFFLARTAARNAGSSAGHVDAWHHWSDALTSAAAFVGILVSWLGGPGYERADPIAAIFASVIIVINGLLLFRHPIRDLMDEEPADIVRKARELAQVVEGVDHVQKVGARTSGTRHWIDMHVWVDPEMNVTRAHTLAHRVKDAVKAGLPSVADVLVHVEPSPQRR